MPLNNREAKRRYDRQRVRRVRATNREQREAEVMAWYREQAENPTDPPPGVSVEQHVHWCRYVLSLLKVEELFGHRPSIGDLIPRPGRSA